MLSRSAARLGAKPLLSRGISSIARPSAVSLGKRPALHIYNGVFPSVGSSRQLSWIPWKSSPSTPLDSTTAVDSPVTSGASIPSGPHDSISSTAHPDLMSPSAPTPTEMSNLSTASSSPSPSDHISTSTGLTDPSSLLPQPPALPTVPTFEDLITKSGMSLSQVLHSNEAVHSAMQMSDLKLVGLQHGWLSLSGWVTDALCGMHLSTGLPWWATIAALTVSIRLCLLPLIVRTLKHNVRLAAVQPQMTALFTKLNEAKNNKDPAAQQVVAKTLTNLMKENDVSPFRPLLMPLVQMPFFLAMFGGLRHLANLPLPQLREGGFGWVTDLTISDPYFILPITSAFFTNAVLKVGADGTGAMNNTNPNMGHFRNAIQLGLLVSIPFIGRMPAAVLFYWTFTNLFTLLQALSLQQPLIKRILKIPTPPAPPPPPPGTIINQNPSYKETWEALRNVMKDRFELAKKQADERALELERTKGGVKKSTTLMQERIYEKIPTAQASSNSSPVLEAVASSKASGNGSGKGEKGLGGASWMESSSATAGEQERLSKDEAKARRVSAARARRRQ